jgi:hypothetical protein
VTTHSTETKQPGRTGLVATLTFLAAVGLPAAAILTAGIRGTEVPPGVIDWIFIAAVAVLTIATFGLLVPWASHTSARRATTTGLTLSISALILSVLFFWTMVPVILGSAGAWLGYTARQARPGNQRRTGAATAAILVGALAALGSVAAYIATS